MVDEEFQQKLIKWIVQNVDSSIVPADEGNSDALVYNMVQLAMNRDERYEYQSDQKDYLRELYRIYGVESDL